MNIPTSILLSCIITFGLTAGLQAHESKKSNSGLVIIDMTANPGDVAVDVNLDFLAPGRKGDTAIDDGNGINVVNIRNFQVISRDTTKTPNEARLTFGETTATVQEDKFGTAQQLLYFADGNHLFDLDRLRNAADWISARGHLQPDADVPTGSYGTINFFQFLSNIQQVRTMYGFVRVKVPLELGTCRTSGNCDRNALGGVVNASSLYGFCETSRGLCSCAPSSGYKIIEGGSNCGLTLPSNAQIRVKGSLLWDFVASADNPAAGLKAGDPIPLTLLPWAPRELYFKVEIPIMVNWEFDSDGDGAMDNMFNIKNVTQSRPAGNLVSPNLPWSSVAPSNKDDYRFYTGKALTQEFYATLDDAVKYHLMMPSGYPQGWAEAFNKLNITGNIWKSIGTEPRLGLPKGFDNTILTADVVRNRNFEDIPAYLYSGGLIDMHDHVNISGLVYVPQGMELEAKDSSLPTRQYIIGAVIVRDTFYIEAKNNTITVISSDPSTYSNAVVSDIFAGTRGSIGNFAFTSALALDTGSPGDDPASGAPGAAGSCYTGCESSSSASGGSKPPGANRWVELRPEYNQ